MDTKAFVVIAEFQVKPGKLEAFLAAAMDDALHSIADEDGCRQFDIACSQSEPDTVVFYEVYDSRAAFDGHLKTPHLRRFQDAFPSLVIEERPIRFLQRRYP
ncbi:MULTISPECIES: putative quinol monooxygenase [unclassified Rhizobium]|uniref:putative quinol monooxygenase n=1 Tax=unclassified Rhizobium TaxID=2613769 RepID=UPI002478AECB|nr:MULTISPECIES: putative quinol monooxygenase [unclassified Rhizobium]MDH7803826.1 quinol monooxygenase YgiN [Rhizobium sp. AN70]